MTPSTVPPYQRIAADLRHRIESGALRPGDPVPSTRELARTWRVASATAAHALRTLVDEGVLRAIPRSRTVVATTSPRALPRSHGSALSQERIVAAAIRIADDEGIAVLSLRSVAAALRVPVTSLYRHVPSKDHLLALMVDAALGEETLPTAVPTGWRAQLEVAARTLWRALQKHPWLARLISISRPAPTPNALRFAEWVLGALEGHGLDASTRLRLHVLLFAFVQGIAMNVELEAAAVGDTGISDDEWMALQLSTFDAIAASGRYPAFGRMMDELTEMFDPDFGVLFEVGLGALLDGIGRVIQRARLAR